MVSLLGERFIFSTPLGQPNFSNFETFVYTHVVLLSNFPEQFELYISTLNIQEVTKFYDPGNKLWKQTLISSKLSKEQSLSRWHKSTKAVERKIYCNTFSLAIMSNQMFPEIFFFEIFTIFRMPEFSRFSMFSRFVVTLCYAVSQKGLFIGQFSH